jgi:hypothetical protein
MNRRSVLKSMLLFAAAPTFIQLENLMPLNSRLGFANTVTLTVSNVTNEDRVYVYLANSDKLIEPVKFYDDKCDFQIPEYGLVGMEATVYVRNTTNKYLGFKGECYLNLPSQNEMYIQRVKDEIIN